MRTYRKPPPSRVDRARIVGASGTVERPVGGGKGTLVPRLTTAGGTSLVGSQPRIVVTVREDVEKARREFSRFCRATGTSAVLVHGMGDLPREGQYHTASYDVCGTIAALEDLVGGSKWWVLDWHYCTSARVGVQAQGSGPEKVRSRAPLLPRKGGCRGDAAAIVPRHEGTAADDAPLCGPFRQGADQAPCDQYPPR